MWRRYQEAQAAKAAAVAQKAAARAERLRLAEEAREANRRRRALEEKSNEWRAVRKRLCTASNGCERDGVPTLEGLALVAVASREGELPALDALEARRACLEAQVVLRVSTGRDAAHEGGARQCVAVAATLRHCLRQVFHRLTSDFSGLPYVRKDNESRLGAMVRSVRST